MDVTRGAEQIITAMITINRSAVALDDGSDPNLIDLTEFRNTYPAEAVRAHDRALGERKNGNLSKAIELLKEAIELAPDFYLAHNTLGLIYQQAGQPNEARHEFLAARALNPRAADPLINLGRLYPQAGEAEESFGNRDQAIETSAWKSSTQSGANWPDDSLHVVGPEDTEDMIIYQRNGGDLPPGRQQ